MAEKIPNKKITVKGADFECSIDPTHEPFFCAFHQRVECVECSKGLTHE